MSHYFPMVSSSPPPFDDNQSFDDIDEGGGGGCGGDGDDEEEFGDFSSSSTTVINDQPYHENRSFNNFAFQCNHVDENDINAKCNDGITLNIHLTNGDEEHDVSRSTDELDVEETQDEVVEEPGDVEASPRQPQREETAVEQPCEWQEDPGKRVDVSEVDPDSVPETADSETVNVSTSLSETRVEDDQFADFQNVIEPSEEDFDDFQNVIEPSDADFDDFQNVVESSEADFDDFQTFRSAECRKEDEESEGQSFEVNFDAFNDNISHSFHNEPEVDDDNDEFGNFESITQVSGHEPLISATLALIFEKVDYSDEDSSLEIVKFEDVLNRKTSTSDCVWEKLKDIDNTQALTYHWSSCRSNKLLLHSLHLNSHNFLASAKWASSIPIFAANLGSDPLEPTKAPLSNVEDGFPTTNHVQPSMPTPITADSVVPPAQFDWGSSGLINPLDGLETEFLGVGRDFGGPVKALSSPLLDKILSEAAAAANRTTSSSCSKSSRHNMSSEAKRILDSLQDLSFMQAKVLMFPIRDGF